MRYQLPTVALVIGVLSFSSASAQTVEELKQQLEAQKQINELLKQRIRTLEEQLAGEEEPAAVPAETARVPEPAPEQQAGDPEEERALERALVRRGFAVLPPKRWELTSGFQWVHDGSSRLRSERDDYIATLDARIGLPQGFMVGARVPYFLKADREFGDNSGFGDLALRVWKQFRPPSDTGPTIVGSLGYRAPTGEDSRGRIPLGSEFHRLSANISLSKSIDPVVFSGSAFYAYSFEERIDSVEFQPGDSYGLGATSSLAITPEITGSLGLSVSFVDELEREGLKLDGTDQTVGFLNVGMGFLVSRKLFVSLFTNVGITDDAPDLVFGVAAPFRF